jgi:biopolymer transport protein ExbD
MRRFSQHNYLVTLSDINITPLLDLAFVLLIIFVITTPMLEQTLSVNLPGGGQPDKRKLDRKDIRTIEVNTRGEYILDKKTNTLLQIRGDLMQAKRQRPNLVVDVRGDEAVGWGKIAAILDICERNGILYVYPRTQPAPRK